MSSVNKVILVGNCGRDAEVRYLDSGMAVANVSLATTSRRKDKQTGEVIEDTQWHRVTFYDRLAEIAGEYVTKGKSIYVEGRIKYGKYMDKDGVEKNSVDIVASELQLLGGRDSGGDGQQQQPQGQRQQRPQQGGQQRPQQRPQQGRQQPRQSSGFEDMDDDIPF